MADIPAFNRELVAALAEGCPVTPRTFARGPAAGIHDRFVRCIDPDP